MKNVFENITVPRKAYFNATGGDVSTLSPNQLYAQYAQYCNANDKIPLSFSDWLTWAKTKGIVSDASATASADGKSKFQSFNSTKFSADAPTTTPTAENTPSSPSASTAENMTTAPPSNTSSTPPSTTPPVAKTDDTKKATDTKMTSLMDKIKANKGKVIAGVILAVAVVLIIKSASKKKHTETQTA
jgi:hypothetical protein